MGLKARIWASRLGFGPRDWDLGLRLGFGPRGWNLGLETGIWASRLEFGLQNWNLGVETGIWALGLGFEGGTEKEKKKKKKEKEEEKIPHMCESIGHRPLRGRCPKTNCCPSEITLEITFCAV